MSKPWFSQSCQRNFYCLSFTFWQQCRNSCQFQSKVGDEDNCCCLTPASTFEVLTKEVRKKDMVSCMSCSCLSIYGSCRRRLLKRALCFSVNENVLYFPKPRMVLYLCICLSNTFIVLNSCLCWTHFIIPSRIFIICSLWWNWSTDFG